MKTLLIILLCIGLSGCLVRTPDVDAPKGTIFKCTSNIDRPTLYAQSDKINVQIGFNGVGTMSFRDIKTCKQYTLHSVEDRDYHCHETGRMDFERCDI